MAQNDSVQALIQEIDEVLNKTHPRLPWVMSNDAMRQRQVLEQARNYLATRQPAFEAGAIEPSASLLPSGQPAAESAQQVLQSVLQEMTYLRVNMLQPMRSDVELLRQQREALTQEIRQLEAQRQQYALPQQPNPQLLMEFFQSAMGQMQENLRGQVAQMVVSLAAESNPPLLESRTESGSVDLSDLANGSASSALSPVQRLEQLQRVQSQSDQLLLKLDSTLQVIFESLQNNIQSYQESLEQGLSRIHGLGQQGEAMFAALVNRLAEQLGREASAYLQSSVQQNKPVGDRPPSRSFLPSKELSRSADAEIARLLEELNALDQTRAQTAQKPAEPVLDLRWQPQPFTLDAEPGSLDALDQNLQQLDLSSVPLELDGDDDEDMTLFQVEPDLPFSYGEDSTRFQINEPTRSAEPEIEDLESALDLLSPLSDDQRDDQRDDQPVEPVDETVSAIAPTQTPLVVSPDSLYEDEFYQSLFGNAAISKAIEPPVAEDETSTPNLSEAAPDGSIEQDLFSGLEDLAAQPQPVQDADAEFLTDFPAGSLPQSVETLLLTEPDPPIAPESPSDASPIEDLFWELQEEDTAPASSADVEVESIAALTDLIPDPPTDPAIDREADQADAFEPDFMELGEDSFEPAQPGEDLLSGTHQELAIADLEVDSDLLQQLSADLSNLETARQPAEFNSTTDAVTPPTAANPTIGEISRIDLGGAGEVDPTADQIASAITLEDLLFMDAGLGDPIPAQETAASEARPETSPELDRATTEEDNTFTLEGLESLFEGVPNSPAPSEAEPSSDLFANLSSEAATDSEAGLPESDPDSKKKN